MDSMDIVTLILIAVSLAMDAFAVSVGSGMLITPGGGPP